MKIPAIALVLIIILFLLSLQCPSIPAAQSQPYSNQDLAILSVSTNTERGGGFSFFGEVQNNLGFTVSQIRLNITVYDSVGRQIGNSTSSPFMESLRPGERSPFEILFANGRTISAFMFYRIEESWHTADSKPALLHIKLDSMQLDSCGILHLTGKVFNDAGANTSSTVVSVALYNSRGQVIGTGWTKSGDISNQIASASSADFEIILAKDMIRSQPAYASFNVQSSQYSAEETVFENMDQRYAASDAWISTDRSSYPIGPSAINITGFVASYNESASPFVIIHLVGTDGTPINTITAKPHAGGQYSNQMNFMAGSGLAGQLLTVRAEYLGKMAENTFIVGSQWQSQPTCDDYVVSVVDQPPMSLGQNNADSNPWTEDKCIFGPTVHESIWVHNGFSKAIPYTAVNVVTNNAGVTVAENSLQGILAPNSWTKLSATWLPSSGYGQYHVKYFIVDDLSAPALIGPPHEYPQCVM